MKQSNLLTLIDTYLSVTDDNLDDRRTTYIAATYNSTAIEECTLTESEVENLLTNGIPTADKPFEHHLMVFDHHQALEFVMQAALARREFTLEFVKELSSKVMRNTGGVVNTPLGSYDVSRGELRLSTVWAGKHLFPDFKKVPELMARFCNSVSERMKTVTSTNDKLDLAFKAHFEFVSIHPFRDGDGRTSRLIMNYILSYFDLPFFIVSVQDRPSYIRSIEASWEKSDASSFLEFMYEQYYQAIQNRIEKTE